jgi:hypothetical protein
MVMLMRMDDKRRKIQKKYRQEIEQKVDGKVSNKERLLIITVLFLIVIIIILFQDVFVNPNNRIIRIIS